MIQISAGYKRKLEIIRKWNPDLELVALKERKNLMNLTEAQKAEELDPMIPDSIPAQLILNALK